jgi:hypothetical protein
MQPWQKGVERRERLKGQSCGWHNGCDLQCCNFELPKPPALWLRLGLGVAWNGRIRERGGPTIQGAFEKPAKTPGTTTNTFVNQVRYVWLADDQCGRHLWKTDHVCQSHPPKAQETRFNRRQVLWPVAVLYPAPSKVPSLTVGKVG